MDGAVGGSGPLEVLGGAGGAGARLGALRRDRSSRLVTVSCGGRSLVGGRSLRGRSLVDGRSLGGRSLISGRSLGGPAEDVSALSSRARPRALSCGRSAASGALRLELWFKGDVLEANVGTGGLRARSLRSRESTSERIDMWLSRLEVCAISPRSLPPLWCLVSGVCKREATSTSSRISQVVTESSRELRDSHAKKYTVPRDGC